MTALNLVGGSYMARSKNFASDRTVNLYPESGNPETKGPGMLIGCPGRRLWTSFTDSPMRGLLTVSTTLAVVVVGASIYTVDTTGKSTLRGKIPYATSLVSMASNGEQVMLVTGPDGFALDLTTFKLTQITTAAFAGANKVDFFDGYFVFNTPGTEQFQITGLYTETIDPLDFASAEGSPDLLVSLIVDHRELWLFGTNSTEVFYNSGNSDFPFERIQGAFIEQGCAAPNSVAKMDNTVWWLTMDDRGQGTVQKAVGYTPQRISDHALEYAIAGYSRIDDAEAYTYQQEGHSFYVLTFPSGNATWVYDAATQLWHQRAYRDPNTGKLGRHRSRCHMSFGGQHIVGDYQNGNLYVLDLNTYTDAGDIMPAIRQLPHVAEGNKWLFFQSLYVDMEMGVGNIIVQKTLPYKGWTASSNDPNGVTASSNTGTFLCSDGAPQIAASIIDAPQLILEWSDDGGASFAEHARMTVSIGKIGERKARAKFRRLGKSKDRVWRLTVTDPVKRIFIGGEVEARLGAA